MKSNFGVTKGGQWACLSLKSNISGKYITIMTNIIIIKKNYIHNAIFHKLTNHNTVDPR